MSKRSYTHVQALLPEIQAKVESGQTQREIAEYYGFKDKAVVKGFWHGKEESKSRVFRNSEAVNRQRH